MVPIADHNYIDGLVKHQHERTLEDLRGTAGLEAELHPLPDLRQGVSFAIAALLCGGALFGISRSMILSEASKPGVANTWGCDQQ